MWFKRTCAPTLGIRLEVVRRNTTRLTIKPSKFAWPVDLWCTVYAGGDRDKINAKKKVSLKFQGKNGKYLVLPTSKGPDGKCYLDHETTPVRVMKMFAGCAGARDARLTHATLKRKGGRRQSARHLSAVAAKLLNSRANHHTSAFAETFRSLGAGRAGCCSAGRVRAQRAGCTLMSRWRMCFWLWR